jgi:hypothetical protein
MTSLTKSMTFKTISLIKKIPTPLPCKQIVPTLSKKAFQSASLLSVKALTTINTIQSNYGVESTYSTVWRALNTVTTLEFEAYGVTFKRAFICPCSNQTAFQILQTDCFSRCLPFPILVQWCYTLCMRARRGGKNGALGYWTSGDQKLESLGVFFTMFSTANPEIKEEGMVVMHDCKKGKHNAQLSILPNSHELICVFHLERTLIHHSSQVSRKDLGSS